MWNYKGTLSLPLMTKCDLISHSCLKNFSSCLKDISKENELQANQELFLLSRHFNLEARQSRTVLASLDHRCSLRKELIEASGKLDKRRLALERIQALMEVGDPKISSQELRDAKEELDEVIILGFINPDLFCSG